MNVWLIWLVQENCILSLSCSLTSNFYKVVNFPPLMVSDEKYRGDIDRCTRIGMLLKERANRLYPTYRPLAERWKEALNYSSVGTAYQYVVNACNGPSAQQLSDASTNSRFKRQEHLTRLSFFYTVMGIEESDEIIGLTRQVNPRFEYPPHEDHLALLTGRSSFPLEVHCDVTVQFHDDSSLTVGQHDHLRRIVALYAAANKTQSH